MALLKRLLGLFSGSQERPPLPPMKMSLSDELAYLEEGDRKERTGEVSVSNPMANDNQRLNRVLEILKEKGWPPLFNNAKDYHHAAVILLHASLPRKSPDLCEKARDLLDLAIKKGANSKEVRWMYAQATDRLLYLQKKPQKYGTFFPDEKNLWPVDPRTTDAERALYGIAPLQHLVKAHELKNLLIDLRPFFAELIEKVPVKKQTITVNDLAKDLAKLIEFEQRLQALPSDYVKQEPQANLVSTFLTAVKRLLQQQINSKNNPEQLQILISQEEQLYATLQQQLKRL